MSVTPPYILIVDDEALNLRLIDVLLKPEGYATGHAVLKRDNDQGTGDDQCAAQGNWPGQFFPEKHDPQSE